MSLLGKIVGDYEVVRQIGEGGFGRTYEGRHCFNPSIKACLKDCTPPSPSDRELYERILAKEAELLSKIHHYSLPAFRALTRSKDGTLVLAMSFIEGKNLEAVLKKHQALHPEEVSWITQRLLNGLFYLHQNGIVHGDVKPPNVLVQPSEHNAWLVDYGLASVHPTSESQALGHTEYFAPPEIIEKKPPVPESDLYSLGLTIICALGGDPGSRQFPLHVPQPMRDFCLDLTKHEVVDRPNWESQDLIRRWSDIRQDVFGRRISFPKAGGGAGGMAIGGAGGAAGPGAGGGKK